MAIDRTPIVIELTDGPVLLEVRRRDSGEWIVTLQAPEFRASVSGRAEAEARARAAIPHFLAAFEALTTTVPVSG